MVPPLEIDDLLNPILREDVVVSSNSFLGTQPAQHCRSWLNGMFASDVPRRMREISSSYLDTRYLIQYLNGFAQRVVPSHSHWSALLRVQPARAVSV